MAKLKGFLTSLTIGGFEILLKPVQFKRHRPTRYFDPLNPVMRRIGDFEFEEQLGVCWDCEDEKHFQSVLRTQVE